MSDPTYPAARAVSERIVAHLAQAAAASPGAGIPELDGLAVEEIISAAFWASLRREEGRAPRISLALIPPDRATRPILLTPQLLLTPQALARMAPAVETPGIHLGVWHFNGDLCVWGATRSIPPFYFVLEVVAPGVLVVKYRRSELSPKFANLAVLEGADVKFLAKQNGVTTGQSPARRALLGFYASAGQEESDSIVVQVAISMRAHGRGGSLLIVPSGDEEWRASIVQPITYLVTPPFSEIALQMRNAENHGTDASDGLRKAVEAVAGLTAVDGATLVSDQWDLLAFGAKIARRDGAARVDRVLVTEPIQNTSISIFDPAQLGGTRHLSAAQFVHDQRGAIALVASQDGRFTMFAWSQANEMVRADRLEALLM